MCLRGEKRVVAVVESTLDMREVETKFFIIPCHVKVSWQSLIKAPGRKSSGSYRPAQESNAKIKYLHV